MHPRLLHFPSVLFSSLPFSVQSFLCSLFTLEFLRASFLLCIFLSLDFPCSVYSSLFVSQDEYSLFLFSNDKFCRCSSTLLFFMSWLFDLFVLLFEFWDALLFFDELDFFWSGVYSLDSLLFEDAALTIQELYK